MSRRIIFLNSVFPCLSETFIYDQFTRLKAAGLDFAITANHRPEPNQVHPQMHEIQAEVDYLCATPLRLLLWAHLWALVRRPLRYFHALGQLGRGEEKFRTALAQLSGAAVLVWRYDHGSDRPHLHAHFTYGAAAVALWAHRLAGLPYTLTLHGSDLIYDQPPDLRVKLRQAQHLVSISRFNADYLTRHYPEIPADRITVLPLGVPPLPPPPRPTPSPVLRILNVGRLSDHKAQHYLVEACALLTTVGVNLRCDIVGTGPRQDFLTQCIAQHQLQDRVHLLGPKFHAEVLALYAEYDVFVLCSITEGMPIVIMEAMRAGIPVIASAIAAIPELVGEGGLLVPAEDPTALATAILQCTQGEVDVATLTQRAQERIATHFDLDTNTQRFRDFLVNR